MQMDELFIARATAGRPSSDCYFHSNNDGTT